MIFINNSSFWVRQRRQAALTLPLFDLLQAKCKLTPLQSFPQSQ